MVAFSNLWSLAENFVAEAVVFMVSHYLGKIGFEMWWFRISISSERARSSGDGY